MKKYVAFGLFLSLGAGLVVALALAPLFLPVPDPPPEPVGDSLVPEIKLHPSVSVHGLPHMGIGTTTAFSPDGRYLVAGSKEAARGIGGVWKGQLTVWEVESKKEVYTQEFPQWIQKVFFHPDGKHLAIAVSSYNISAPEGFMHFVQKPAEVLIYAFPEMKEIKRLTFDTLVGYLAYSPDGKFLAINKNKNAKLVGPSDTLILETETYECKMVIPSKPNVDGLHVLAFSPDSKEILITEPIHEREGVVNAFDVNTGDFLRTVMLDDRHPLNPGNHLQFAPDGRLISIAFGMLYPSYDYYEGKVAWNTVTKGLILRPWTGYKIYAADFSLDEKYLLATATYGSKRFAKSKVYLDDQKTGVVHEVFEHLHSRVVFPSCAFSSDGHHFAVGADAYKGVLRQQDPEFRGYVLLFRINKAL